MKTDRPYKNSIKNGISALLITCAASAAVYGGYGGVTDSDIGPNGQISLNRTIHGDRGARIHIQFGEVKSDRGEVVESEPYCYFKIHRPGTEMGAPVDIQATTFSVIDVRIRNYQVQLHPQNAVGIQYASSAAGRDGGGAHQMTLATEFHLQSPAQPRVKKLICAVWSDPRDRGHVTVDEIRQTLGDIADIK